MLNEVPEDLPVGFEMCVCPRCDFRWPKDASKEWLEAMHKSLIPKEIK